MASPEGDTTANYTDPSITFSTTLDTTSSNKLDVTGEELEKRQLQHRIDLLKLELSQKALIIDTLRNEQASQVEELRDQLSDTLHKKKMLHMRLTSLTHVHEQEMQQLQIAVRDLERQREEERVRGEGERGEEERGEEMREVVREALHRPPLSEDEYLALRGRGEEEGKERERDTQALADYVRVRVYEITEPLCQVKVRLEGTVSELSAQLVARDQEITAAREVVSSLSAQLQTSRSHTEQLASQLDQVRSQVRDGDHKIANFDRLMRERDGLRSELERLGVSVGQSEAVLQEATQDRDAARREMFSLQQTVSLLQQDKDYLSRQVSELGSRAVAAEGREAVQTQKLAESQATRDQLYQETVQTREKERAEAEERLQRELGRLRDQARQELEHSRTHSRELYERENRALTESYSRAAEERDRAVAGEREASHKHEQLLQDHHRLQSRMETRLSELQAALQVKTFECQQSQLSREQCGRQLRESQLLADTLQKKVDVLSEEVHRVRGESGERVRVLEGTVREQADRLTSYQQMETEMDDVILQAAQAESETDSDRILFSYGFGANLPTTSRRRAQQSVQLARRVLQLERVNSALRKDTEIERTHSQQLQDELADVRSLLSQVSQPQSCLLQSLREKQEEAHTHRDRVTALERELDCVKTENKKLQEVRSQLAADLETLLNHREELSVMKQLLLSLQGKSSPAIFHPPPTTSSHREGETGGGQFSPRPVLFTKQESLECYKHRHSSKFRHSSTTT